MRRDSFASIREHQLPGLARLGQPLAIAGPARPLQRSGACLVWVLEAMINLRVLIASVWEENRCNRYRCAVH